MTTTLYDLSVATYLQMLGGAAGVLERGMAHCVDNNIDPGEIVDTRLFPDMLPFRFQVQQIEHHSLGAIKGLQAGQFSPWRGPETEDYRALQARIAATRAALEALTPGDVNALAGKDVAFVFGDMRLPFTAENFVLSFSLPNFFFHAATAYDILRMKGAPIGKRDYMGPPRIKG